MLWLTGRFLCADNDDFGVRNCKDGPELPLGDAKFEDEVELSALALNTPPSVDTNEDEVELPLLALESDTTLEKSIDGAVLELAISLDFSPKVYYNIYLTGLYITCFSNKVTIKNYIVTLAIMFCILTEQLKHIIINFS